MEGPQTSVCVTWRQRHASAGWPVPFSVVICTQARSFCSSTLYALRNGTIPSREQWERIEFVAAAAARAAQSCRWCHLTSQRLGIGARGCDDMQR